MILLLSLLTNLVKTCQILATWMDVKAVRFCPSVHCLQPNSRCYLDSDLCPSAWLCVILLSDGFILQQSETSFFLADDDGAEAEESGADKYDDEEFEEGPEKDKENETSESEAKEETDKKEDEKDEDYNEDFESDEEKERDKSGDEDEDGKESENEDEEDPEDDIQDETEEKEKTETGKEEQAEEVEDETDKEKQDVSVNEYSIISLEAIENHSCPKLIAQCVHCSALYVC